MSFHAHIGTNFGLGNGLYTALPLTTYDTLLDDIVADVNAAIAAGKANGWSVHDDMRAPGAVPQTCPLYALPVVPGILDGGCQTYGFTFTNGSTSFTAGSGSSNGLTLLRRWVPGLTKLTFGNWVNPEQNSGIGIKPVNPAITTTVATITNEGSGTFASAWTQGSCSYGAASYNASYPPSSFAPGTSQAYGHCVMEIAGPSIVLKCVGSTRTFYVSLTRPVSHSDVLRVQTWETWDEVAHTGTYPSNSELLRGYTSRTTGSKALGYCMWLLPDVFAFWDCADPATTTAFDSDFYYAGLLAPTRDDDEVLVQACTNLWQSGSGAVNADGSWRNHRNNCIQVHKAYKATERFDGYLFNGNKWTGHANEVYWGYNVGAYNYLRPVVAGLCYIDNLASLSEMDFDGNMAMTTLEAWEAWGGHLRHGTLGKRADFPWLKIPCFHPGNRTLQTYGPTDDGHTYLMLGCASAWGSGDPYLSRGYTGSSIVGLVDANPGNSLYAVCSSFVPGSYASGYAGTGNSAVTTDRGLQSQYAYIQRSLRFFLMPIDV